MHYHAVEQNTDKDNFSIISYLKEIHHRWNHPMGRQLRLPGNRCITEAPGWSVATYDMFQHRQEEKLLGVLAQLCMAKKCPPPGRAATSQGGEAEGLP